RDTSTESGSAAPLENSPWRRAYKAGPPLDSRYRHCRLLSSSSFGCDCFVTVNRCFSTNGIAKQQTNTKNNLITLCLLVWLVLGLDTIGYFARPIPSW